MCGLDIGADKCVGRRLGVPPTTAIFAVLIASEIRFPELLRGMLTKVVRPLVEVTGKTDDGAVEVGLSGEDDDEGEE